MMKVHKYKEGQVLRVTIAESHPDYNITNNLLIKVYPYIAPFGGLAYGFEYDNKSYYYKEECFTDELTLTH